MTVYAARYAWVDGRRAPTCGSRSSDGRIAAVDHGAGAARRRAAARPRAARLRQHPQPRLPPRAARPHVTPAAGRSGPGGRRCTRWPTRLTPTPTSPLARAVYAEMVLAGITCVGEFHYLHDGAVGAERDGRGAGRRGRRGGSADHPAGRLLPRRWHRPGPLRPEQPRFSDGTRRAGRPASPSCRPLDARPDRRGGAQRARGAARRHRLPWWRPPTAGRCTCTCPSSRPRTSLRRAPTADARPRCSAGAGALGPTTTAVHATHLSDADIGLLGDAGVAISVCPTTERDLADGIGPARRLVDAGCRAHPGHRPARRHRPVRGGARAGDGRAAGHRSRGHLPPRGAVRRADRARQPGLARRRRAGPGRAGRPGRRPARHRPHRGRGTGRPLLAAGAADVDTVVVDGQVVVRAGRHRLGDVGGLLTQAVGAVHR